MNSISIYTISGKEQGTFALDNSLIKKEVKAAAFSTAIRVLLQNWRQGTVACKGRSDVNFSNKKPWRQKGTGRARAGTRRSPLWRKGGVAFGPQPRVRTLDINRGQNYSVMNNVFFDKLEHKSIYCLDALFAEGKPNTKKAGQILNSLGLGFKKVLVLLPVTDLLTYASLRNIPNVNILFFDQPNAFDLSNTSAWVFLKRDAELFNNMVLQWN